MAGPGSVVPTGVSWFCCNAGNCSLVKAKRLRSGGFGFLRSVQVQAGVRVDRGAQGQARTAAGHGDAREHPCSLCHQFSTNLRCHEQRGLFPLLPTLSGGDEPGRFWELG